MKKAIGQTVRDLKREVNKKVLKVPSIEQKVLDATSNEPWGPHGSLLADIAQATRNYHEYQMIMSVIWKRTNDTGKNWRHVYKALTVLEYLVAHGSERVIDDIREHAYQISTLSDFQYIDSSGKDQGNNVRKKSQSLVVLVNDKERIQEVRQKAATNRDKYRGTPVGGLYRPGSSPSSGGYGDRSDDERYGNRDDDRNSYGREREWGSRDDDRYGRDGDRYSRDNEERYGRDGYRDDDHRGRGQNIDEYHYGSRSRSADRDMNRSNEDDSQYSSRGSGAKADDHSQDGRSLDRKYSGQSFGVPPSYEDAVGANRSPPYSDRDRDSSLGYAPKASSPTGASPSHASAAAVSPPAPATPPASAQPTTQHSNKEVDGFDEFDPRGSFSVTSTTSNGAAPAASAVEMDLLGSLSESFSSNSFALVPASQPTMIPEADASSDFNSGPTIGAASLESTINNQPFDDPFGDGPFKAVSSANSVSIQQQITTSTNSFNLSSSQSLDVPQQIPQKAATEFGGPFYDATYMPSGPSGVQSPPTSTQFVQQEFSTPNQDFDILADILPPSAPSSFVNAQAGYPVPPNQSVSHSGFPPQTNQPGQNVQPNSFQAQSGLPTGFPAQLGQPSLQTTSYPLQSAESVSQTGFPAQTMALTYPVQAGQASQMGFQSQSASGQPSPNIYGTYNSQSVSTGSAAAAYMISPAQHNFLSQSGSAVPIASQMGPQSSTLMAPVSTNSSSTGSSAIVPQSSNDKFETKSTVWADTLSRGLVNLNISGSKTNPLADIGVDFDAINRKEKRMEKPTTTVASTVTMGKAMGSGSGIGRAGATALRPPPNPMMGSVMNVGINGGPGAGMGMGMGMGGYGVSQPVGRGMGMGMPGNMGMGMNMVMGQGVNMQQQMGTPPGSTMPGVYNHNMGTGNYSQQPYGGGYR
ncbi:clathrin interactor epsin 2 [Phtheirospermum japonicum]|uniref:Clathrin interactor epsin 2 n=1 Tax=Phtheirospermum japonicum TaxID=374723 RepID=A0A830B0Z5_9LAMI|nr:clathrin interactor epsin 2 [Phtheirospermum japonicum]